MQIAEDRPKPEFSMTCASCVYLSPLGRCQRVKSRFYASLIEYPTNFICARYERSAAKEEGR